MHAYNTTSRNCIEATDLLDGRTSHICFQSNPFPDDLGFELLDNLFIDSSCCVDRSEGVYKEGALESGIDNPNEVHVVCPDPHFQVGHILFDLREYRVEQVWLVTVKIDAKVCNLLSNFYSADFCHSFHVLVVRHNLRFLEIYVETEVL